MKAPFVSPSNIQYSENVVVLGAGPSVNSNISVIEEWSKNSVVVASNYRFPVKSQYTVFVSSKIFNKNKKTSSGKLIVSSHVSSAYYQNKDIYKRTMVLGCNTKQKVWHIPNISVSENYFVNHDVVSAGFAAILFATFFKPKNMLIVGFDGYKHESNKMILDHFNNDKQVRKKDDNMQHHDYRMTKYFRELLIPYLISNGINLYSFKSDLMRSINKLSCGVKII